MDRKPTSQDTPGVTPEGTHQLSAEEHAYRLAGRRKAMVSDAIADFRATFDKSGWWCEVYAAYGATEDDRDTHSIAFVEGMKAQRDIDEVLNQPPGPVEEKPDPAGGQEPNNKETIHE